MGAVAEWKAREVKQPLSDCYKIAYTSRKCANGAVRVTELRSPRPSVHPFVAYKCRVCHCWHIGHDRFTVKDA